MSMPETAMHKYNCLAARKDKVRFARKALVMKPVTVAHCVQPFSYQHFGTGIFPPDP
jgi:hypothetical protein